MITKQRYPVLKGSILLILASLTKKFLKCENGEKKDQDRAVGLMFRPSLPRDRGMLLLWSEERYATIWMMNVLVPLDIVFLDDAGEVIEIVADARPCAAEPCPRFTPDEPSRAVLELATGSAAAHGVAVGESIEFERVPGYPVSNSEFGIRNSE